jgi:hypothetical protein
LQLARHFDNHPNGQRASVSLYEPRRQNDTTERTRDVEHKHSCGVQRFTTHGTVDVGDCASEGKADHAQLV